MIRSAPSKSSREGVTGADGEGGGGGGGGEQTGGSTNARKRRKGGSRNLGSCIYNPLTAQ
jgi:hypothetical protein